jgi:hypothetical protein
MARHVEPNTSGINSLENETFGETYSRLEREAWKSGANLTGTEVSICCLEVLLTVLTLRQVGRLAHRTVEST